jgi:DNA (cytosine-5)-methyltransferase 1
MHLPDSTAPSEIIDLFAGPGGLDMAAHALLIPVTGIEFDVDACATRSKAGLDTRPCDVRSHGPADFPAARILAGGPPCQTFTVAGNGAGRAALDQVVDFATRMAEGEDVRPDLKSLSDERTGLVLEPLRWALEAMDVVKRPYKVIILEQVPAVLPVWTEFRKILRARGYEAECEILHTEEFGVPQTRRRAILIARLRDRNALVDYEINFPTPTHERFQKQNGIARKSPQNGRQRSITMGDVLKWREKPFEVVSNYGTGGDPKDRGLRTYAEPAFTVTGKISRNRVRTGAKSHGVDDCTRFENYEAGVLQTFPATYPWSGRAVAQQIGNAIPPRLGIHVLAAALDLGEEEVSAALKRLETWEEPSHPTTISCPLAHVK